MGLTICNQPERSRHKDNENTIKIKSSPRASKPEKALKTINTGRVINVNFRADTEDFDKKITVYESNTLREAIQVYQEQINKEKSKIKTAIYEPDSTELNLDTPLNELNINFFHTILLTFE